MTRRAIFPEGYTFYGTPKSPVEPPKPDGEPEVYGGLYDMDAIAVPHQWWTRAVRLSKTVEGTALDKADAVLSREISRFPVFLANGNGAAQLLYEDLVDLLLLEEAGKVELCPRCETYYAPDVDKPNPDAPGPGMCLSCLAKENYRRMSEGLGRLGPEFETDCQPGSVVMRADDPDLLRKYLLRCCSIIADVLYAEGRGEVCLPRDLRSQLAAVIGTIFEFTTEEKTKCGN